MKYVPLLDPQLFDSAWALTFEAWFPCDLTICKSILLFKTVLLVFWSKTKHTGFCLSGATFTVWLLENQTKQQQKIPAWYFVSFYFFGMVISSSNRLGHQLTFQFEFLLFHWIARMMYYSFYGLHIRHQTETAPLSFLMTDYFNKGTLHNPH